MARAASYPGAFILLKESTIQLYIEISIASAQGCLGGTRREREAMYNCIVYFFNKIKAPGYEAVARVDSLRVDCRG